MTDPLQQSGGTRPVRELWVELGATMRLLRTRAGMSLRQAELASGRGRGTLSQVENGKARAGRDLVEWYDRTFGADGLLLSIYAEARSAHGPQNPPRSSSAQPLAGDTLEVSDALLPTGALVAPGSTVTAGWTLVNAGQVPWMGRHLRRVGTYAGIRLIRSAPSVPVPDCKPGDQVPVRLHLQVPPMPGTFAAYWQLVDAQDRPCFPPPTPFAIVVTSVSL